MHVFIDTSVFETNNFLEGSRINQLLRLSEEGELKIILTRITYYELISRFRKNVRLSNEAFKSFRDKNRALRNLASKKALFDTTEEDESVREFTQALDNKLQQAKCLILDYPTLNIGEVFDKYFARSKPFGEGGKKDEFPDAFALLTLEKWCIENNQQCHVLSIDKDMLEYDSPQLVVAPNYEGFLDETLRDIQKNKEIIDKALQYLALHQDEVIQAVGEWLESILYDDSRYKELANHMEIYSVEIKERDIELDDPKVISTNTNAVEIETLANVYFNVEYEIADEEYGIYDEDHRLWLYPYTVFKQARRTEVIPVVVKVDISIKDTHIKARKLNIIKINSGKELTLRKERGFHHR